MLVRIFLIAVSLSFVAFGVWALFDPAALGRSLGIDFAGANGIYEARGIYGGVSLGVAALTAAGAARTGMTRPALWFIVTYMGGYVFARIAGLLLGDTPTSSFLLFTLFESTCLVLAALALRNLRTK